MKRKVYEQNLAQALNENDLKRIKHKWGLEGLKKSLEIL